MYPWTIPGYLYDYFFLVPDSIEKPVQKARAAVVLTGLGLATWLILRKKK